MAIQVCLAISIVAASAVVIAALQSYAARRENARQSLQELRTDTAILSQLEWQSVAEKGVSDEVAAAVTKTRMAATRDLQRARAQLGGEPQIGRVERVLEDYLDAVADEFDLIARGRLDEAKEVDEARVDPTFAALRTQTVALQRHAAVEADRAALIGLAGTIGVLLIGLVAIVALFWRLATALEAARDSLFDPLTGLANRMLLTDRLSQAVSLAGRSGTRAAVLFLDLDDFKRINDTLGHAAGDSLLRGVAQRLLDAGRASDTVARLGGDEFAVVLHGVAGEADATAAAAHLVEQLEKPFTVSGHQVTVTASIGCALSDGTGSAADDLLRNADLAMYAGKRQGKHRFVLYEPTMYDALADRLQLESDLREALGRREISVAYQPIVEVATGRLRGMEALARWTHPVRGIIGPALFIPLAEETRLIHEIGRFVLTESIQQLGRWQADREFIPPLGLNLNVSPVQLQEGRLISDVREALAASGIDPGCVTLEITESVLAARGDDFASTLAGLHDLGVRLAVDDFGTGYSSLSSLTRFPIDMLKIDRSFVENLEHGNGLDLVRSIVDLGRTLGLDAVAEGIETIDQANVLRGLNCGLGQGFHFAHPLAAEDVDAYLAAQSPPARRVAPPAPVTAEPGRLLPGPRPFPS